MLLVVYSLRRINILIFMTDINKNGVFLPNGQFDNSRLKCKNRRPADP